MNGGAPAQERLRSTLRRSLRWLEPGLGVKRYIFLIALGVLLVAAGAALIVDVKLLGVRSWR